MKFDGDTYDRGRDKPALKAQLDVVREVMEDGNWHSLGEIRTKTEHETGKHATEQSICARIKDLRNDKFGGYNIEHRCRTGRAWQYRMVL